MPVIAWALVAFAGSLLAAWLSARVALAPFRASALTATWTERARLAFPARAASRRTLLVLPLAYATVGALQADEWSSRHAALAVAAFAGPALLGALVGLLSVERTVLGKPVGAGEVLRGWIAFWTVMAPHGVIAIVGLLTVTDTIDARTAGVLVAAAAAVVAVFAGAGIALARIAGVARPASERLLRAVAAASRATGIEPRAVLVLDLRMANALALPAARTLLFTPRALRALNDAQIAAIARHELAHVSEPPRVVAARAAGAVVLVLAVVSTRPVSGLLSPEAGLLRLAAAVLVLVLALAFVRLVMVPLARRMEQRADAIAGAHDREDKEYASALEAIYAANLMPAVGSVRGAHPHLYDRLVAAGAPPPWPRPAPPSRSRQWTANLVCLGLTAVTLAVAVAFFGSTLPSFLHYLEALTRF
jgi:Zn-dependent protease with chaperone function